MTTEATPQRVDGVLRNIRAEMARSDYTQARLAAVLGISQVAVSKRLRGVVPLSVPELFAVAEFLDVPPSQLLGNAA
jgi:transcriptional regulator with XRE-family HTH domain